MLATLAAGPGDLLDCYSEPIRGGGGDRLYTIELVNEEGTRWFGIHSKSLGAEPLLLVTELRLVGLAIREEQRVVVTRRQKIAEQDRVEKNITI